MATLETIIAIIITLFIIITHCEIPQNHCKSTRNFHFDNKPPTKQSLPFCKQYSDKTCCTPSNSLQIFQQIRPMLQNEHVSQECKQLTMDIMCSTCNPQIGTNDINGICIV